MSLVRSLAMMRARAAGIVTQLFVLGCPSERTPPAQQSPPAPERAEAAPVPASGAALGRVLPDAPLPIAAILGAAPPEAESHLGPPLGKGVVKNSCVRFLPERVFFACAHAWQRYADRTGTFGAIEVRYEDGRAASIAFEQLPGEGAFDPRVALARVGVDLPGEPEVDTPATDVTRWSWFNAAARLRVHERQYRVEVSSVGGAWNTAKVDLVLNDPLTEAQTEAIVQPSSVSAQ